MAELKTKVNKASVKQFIDKVPDEQRRADCRTILKMMQEATGAKAEMWGDSIVGFGRLRYKYSTGREAEWMVIGFSPRKNYLTVYLMGGLQSNAKQLKRLGKHRTGGGCLYIKKLEDIDLEVLREIVDKSVTAMNKDRIDKPKS
jgi:hypothetical protein